MTLSSNLYKFKKIRTQITNEQKLNLHKAMSSRNDPVWSQQRSSALKSLHSYSNDYQGLLNKIDLEQINS